MLLLTASLLAVNLFAGRSALASAGPTAPEQNPTATPIPTLFLLPTATSTPSPTPTPTFTATPTPTPAPNQLLCFRASNRAEGGYQLGWLVERPDGTASFALFRAEVLSTTDNTHTPFIPNKDLRPSIPPATSQEFTDSQRHLTLDSGTETGKSYIYKLNVVSAAGAVLFSLTTDSPGPSIPPDPDLCDPTRSDPPTPTATQTAIALPTASHTPTRTPTATWTWTPTITPTSTWTPTPLPADTATPRPTPTETPLPSNTPEPPTDTPSPTFTITPTASPDIQQPTATETPFGTPESSDPAPPPVQDTPPSQDAPPDPPTPEPTPELAPRLLTAPEFTPTARPAEPATPGEEEIALLAKAEEEAPDIASAQVTAGEAPAARPVQAVRVGDFRAQLIPASRANLFRYALFGVAGLGFAGALVFLLASIGFRRQK